MILDTSQVNRLLSTSLSSIRSSEIVASCARIDTEMMSFMEEPAMICAECFRAKGEPEAKVPCQNPRCHFYLRTQPVDHELTTLSVSFADGLAFSREVGRDRATVPKTGFGSDLLLHSAEKASIWGFHPISTASRTLHSQLQGPIFSTSTDVRSGGVGKARSMSIGDQSRKSTAEYAREKKSRAKLMRNRARVMSVPVSSGGLAFDDCDLADVEDAFLNSPLPPELRTGDMEVSMAMGFRVTEPLRCNVWPNRYM